MFCFLFFFFSKKRRQTGLQGGWGSGGGSSNLREGGGNPFVEKREIQEKAGGINANYFYLDALSNQRLSVSLLLLALASPVAYFILLGIVRYYRKIASDPALLRQRGAWKKARGRLAEARSQMEGEARTFFDLLSRSLGGFMEDRYNLGEGEFTLVDLDALVRDQRISSELAGEARNVLDQCDAGRFGSSLLSTEERPKPRERNQDLLKKPGRTGKRRGGEKGKNPGAPPQ